MEQEILTSLTMHQADFEQTYICIIMILDRLWSKQQICHMRLIINYMFLCYYILLCMAAFLVNGGWSDWVAGPCSKSCGGGTHNITRRCSNPSPSCNGKVCEGENYLVYPGKCNDFCCPGM